MKKICFFYCVCFFMFFLCNNVPASAKNYSYTYIVKNTTPDTFYSRLFSDLRKNNFENFISNENTKIFYVNDSTFYTYMKLYINGKNTELFVSTNDKNNIVLSKIKASDSSIYPYNDKSLQNVREEDFHRFIAQNNIENKNIKVNTIKLQKPSSQSSYNPYRRKLYNAKFETISINENNINITRTKLKPKAKVKHYVYGYEYIITNNTGKDIVIKKVASEDFIGLTQITAYCAIPRGKDFIPIYNLVYGVQTDLEKNKFTRPHPVNEIIKSDQTMRILSLAKKDTNPASDFIFIIDNNEVLIKF